VADGLVARQPQAAVDVFCRANDAFFGGILHRNSGLVFIIQSIE